MKKFILIVSLFLIFTFTGCTMFLPSYDVNYSKETGSTINVFGVTYKDTQKSDWQPIFYNDDVLIGTLKDTIINNNSVQAYLSRADEKKVFVITRVSYFLIDNNISDSYYARADITLPSFDRSGIDALALVDQEKKQYKVITDKDLLDKLWDTMESNEKKNEDSGNFFPSEQELWFMNSKYMGIGIEFANAHITLPQDIQWNIMDAGKSVAYHQIAG